MSAAKDFTWTTISTRTDWLERIRKSTHVPHEHGDGMNECHICDKDLIEDVADQLELRAARIKELEKECAAWKEKYSIWFDIAVFNGKELHRIKEGAVKLPFVTVQREHIDMQAGIVNVIFKSDLDKLMKGE